MAERFYLNCPLQRGPVVVEGPEAHHLATVRRLRPGDAICLFNGNGREYQAVITAIHRREVEVEVQREEYPQRELDFALEVAAPLPKGDRAQFLIEKLTELGATSFVPLRTRYSVVDPREARLEKLQRHVVEAAKQCGRNLLMGVGPVADWADFCRQTPRTPLRLVAHPGGEQGAADALAERQEGVTLAVGPEGGFTDEEIGLAEANGWGTVTLGPRILRVETAALLLTGLAAYGTGMRKE